MQVKHIVLTNMLRSNKPGFPTMSLYKQELLNYVRELYHTQDHAAVINLDGKCIQGWRATLLLQKQ